MSIFLPPRANRLSPHMWIHSQRWVLGWRLRTGGGRGTAGMRAEAGNKLTVFVSRHPQNNGELALSSPASAQLFIAPEPLLSPSGRPDHRGGRGDAEWGGKGLLMLTGYRGCTVHSISPRVYQTARSVAVPTGLEAVSLTRLQIPAPASPRNAAGISQPSTHELSSPEP